MVIAAGGRRLAVWLAIGLSSACSFSSWREEQFVRGQLESIPGVDDVQIGCGASPASAEDGACATITLRDGSVIRFLDLGYSSFGPAPSRVRLAEAGGRAPLIVSCAARWDIADVDRSGLFGHHFTPAMDGVTAALRRHHEVVEELEFWPQCPQFWEIQPAAGPVYRYCAHATGATPEPPPRPCDQSLDSAK
jgi:hypothetical protein